MKIATGSTPQGDTNWQNKAGEHTVWVDVDTSAAGFATKPQYITSLGGNQRQFQTTGGCCVYHASATGFRVYVYFEDDVVSPQQANEWGWHINWIAMTNDQ